MQLPSIYQNKEKGIHEIDSNEQIVINFANKTQILFAIVNLDVASI